ncbi:hypothetical protein KAFR_0D02330 [Kazachstania africana CBS 2517]|uniref:Patatin-like phospholipase domain-containing protein n=1 Tax=Kazachstania africana (strain ATCC 22294 / BCRC 22015 / CBS 2517 / CECT 1963 / NBRC 1671 / NRRL Y-8276) TaxID=1071382 RepID=H2AU30_KAZAF|nr:hypothetical protein KAFR_0D02330 [Kazachstania africana CBS 2517]CCF57880.1 hypothetical protein KAFR_0D02330 [Kazachstania africana CBS 2517]
MTSYPVTQYLIERYYESIGKLLPDSINLPLHKDSNELLQIIEDVDTSLQLETSTDVSLDSIDNETCSTEHISKFDKLLAFCYSLVGKASYNENKSISQLQAERADSISYDQWKITSLKLDALLKKEEWKLNKESSLYDWKLIEEVTEQLRFHRENKNYDELLYLIRVYWKRRLGNIDNVNLYKYCNFGTKKAIEEYLLESKLSIDCLLNESDIDDHYLLNTFQQTKRNIGKSALVLSGGATFGLFHIGVLAALFEADLLPKVISGTSAGAIVASIFCVHTKDEIPSLLTHVLDMEFNIFNDRNDKTESEKFLTRFERFFKSGTWFDSGHLVNTMIGFLGDMTFREAYYRTGRILNITVSPASLFEQPRLLNYLTAPNVMIWSAVCASCSVPGVFPATPLYEKDQKKGTKQPWTGNKSVKFVDGSVDNDLPISRLSEMFNVDNIIACQVNIHVFPFLKFSNSCVGGEIEYEVSAKLRNHLSQMYNFTVNEIVHYMEMIGELGFAKTIMSKLRSVLSQQYSGNITILPDVTMMLKSTDLLTNPTQKFLLEETTYGARATWPKLSIIHNSCGQEFALDRAIQHLKGKIIMSSSIKNQLQFSDGALRLRGSTDVKTFDHKEPALEDDNLADANQPNFPPLVVPSNLTARRLRSLSVKVPLNRKFSENSVFTLPKTSRTVARTRTRQSQSFSTANTIHQMSLSPEKHKKRK